MFSNGDKINSDKSPRGEKGLQENKQLQELIVLAKASRQEFVTVADGKVISIKSRVWPYTLPIFCLIPFLLYAYTYPSFYHLFGMIGFIVWFFSALKNPGIRIKIVNSV